MKVQWDAAEPPLPAVAVAGRGVVGERLAARASVDERWDLVCFTDWCVLTGDDLPWVDGVVYLGVLPGTIDVLIPVHRRPRLHPGLVTRAVTSMCGAERVALIPDDDGVSVLPLGGRR